MSANRRKAPAGRPAAAGALPAAFKRTRGGPAGVLSLPDEEISDEGDATGVDAAAAEQ